jgi:acetyltransferase
LLETVIRFSYLVANCPQIAEMDVNPLLVTPRDVIALDARVRIDRSHPADARPFSHLAIRPYPESLVHTASLRDATPITVRPIRPEDEPLWHRMLGECSPESIRLRFRSMFREMSHEMATRYCFMDYDRELAMVAEVSRDADRCLIGVGHLLGDADHTQAEFAVLVPDAWQRKGVGALLLDACLEVAKDWGLREVVGETERVNTGMLATFRNAGFELHYHPNTDTVRVSRQLAAGQADAPVDGAAPQEADRCGTPSASLGEQAD